MCGIPGEKNTLYINHHKCEMTLNGKVYKTPKRGDAVAYQMYFYEGRFYFNTLTSNAIPPPVNMTANEVTIGCNSATRESVEELYRLFQKNFPKSGEPKGIEIQ